jgi:AcrR family transcriptional regulator
VSLRWAARAKTAVGSLYQFFPDKLAIFNALELRHVERVHIMWERLSHPEIIQLPFVNFIHTLVTQVQELFEQPTSRIVFRQFFVSPTILMFPDALYKEILKSWAIANYYFFKVIPINAAIGLT